MDLQGSEWSSHRGATGREKRADHVCEVAERASRLSKLVVGEGGSVVTVRADVGVANGLRVRGVVGSSVEVGAGDALVVLSLVWLTGVSLEVSVAADAPASLD